MKIRATRNCLSIISPIPAEMLLAFVGAALVGLLIGVLIAAAHVGYDAGYTIAQADAERAGRVHVVTLEQERDVAVKRYECLIAGGRPIPPSTQLDGFERCEGIK